MRGRKHVKRGNWPSLRDLLHSAPAHATQAMPPLPPPQPPVHYLSPSGEPACRLWQQLAK